MAQVIAISRVVPDRDVAGYFIRRMKDTLNQQGQIEPLQVRKITDNTGEWVYMTFEEDAHGSTIVYAARDLGWFTLLVVEMTKYEG